jgi:hypothetical protein
VNRQPDIEQEKNKHLTDEKRKKKYNEIFTMALQNLGKPQPKEITF